MQDATTDTTQTQQPVAKSATSLAALEASFQAIADLQLVTHEENAAKVKAALKDAQKLLKGLRGEDEDEEEPEVEETKDNTVRELARNANISPDQQRQIDLATEQFKQSVTRVDNQILNKYIQAIQNGDYAQAEAILKAAQQASQVSTLTFALITIGAILLPVYAKQRLQSLLTQFGLHTVYAQTADGQRAMKQQAEKGAKSHVRTIAKDLKKALDNAIDSELTNPVIEAEVKDKYEALAEKDDKGYVRAVKKDKEIYKYARDLILSGASRDVIIQKLQENFADVSKRRANVIAGNESNRVFTVSQFEADAQFLAQNKLTSKAYKRLVSNTGNPCPICDSIIKVTHAHPIPFKNDFAEFGVEMQVPYEKGGKEHIMKFTPNYEHLKSGHIHVNCHCRYELLIKQDDGTWLNSNTGQIQNDFEEDKHKRDKDGKFTKKPGSGISNVLDISKIGSKKDFDEYVSKSAKEYDTPQAKSARLYQSHNFYKLNDAVRLGDESVEIKGKKISVKKFQESFDSTFDLELKQEATLYRGVPTFPDDFKVNQQYDNDGYTSTSTVESTAREKFKAPSGSVIHLKVPAGTKVSLPDLVARDITGTHLDEQEAVLPVGAKYIVYAIEGDKVYATLL